MFNPNLSPAILLPFRCFSQFLRRYYSSSSSSSSSSTSGIPSDDPQLFLKSVRQQCQLGFTNPKIPLSIFHQLNSLNPRPSIIVFTQLLSAMVKIRPNPPLSTVVTLFNHLELSGLRPNHYSLGIMSNCYCRLGRVDFAFSLLGKRIKLGYPPDVVTFNTLINGYCKCKQVDKAMILFEDMRLRRTCLTPDVVTYTTLIDALCKDNNVKIAYQKFEEMKDRGVAPNVVTYNSLLDGLLKNAEIDKAMSLLREMEKDAAGRPNESVDVFTTLVAKGLQPNVSTYNTMIKVLCKQGLLTDATALLKKMEDTGFCPDERTFNTIIKGFLNANDVANALDYLHVMRSHEFAADAKTTSLFMELAIHPNVSEADKALLYKYFFEHHSDSEFLDFCTPYRRADQIMIGCNQIMIIGDW